MVVDFRTKLVNLFDRCLDKCCLMFQHILVILLSALLDVWAYVGHVAHVPLSSNPQARWRVWPEGQLDPAPPQGCSRVEPPTHSYPFLTIPLALWVSPAPARPRAL